VVAVAAVDKADTASFEKMCGDFKAQFNDKRERTWGGGIMGLKTQKRLEIRQKAIEAELAKKAAY
jgi:large subunit ribosomal protein L7Ae